MELWQFLSLSLLVAFATGSISMWSALILLGNWAVNTSAAVLSGSQFNWMAMACVDYVSALLILMICPNKWTVGLAVLYAVEMVAHGAFGMSSGGPWALYHYWNVLHVAAWAQGWLLLVWVGLDGGKMVRRRFDIDRFVEPIASLPYRMGLFRKRDR